MKNFLIAFLVFLVWSFFGLWLYAILQPDSTSKENETEVAIGELEESAKTEIDSPSAITDSPYLTGNEPDSLLIDESYKEEYISAPVTGLKAVSEKGDIIFLYPEGFKITKNISEVNIPPRIVDFKYKLNTYILEHPNTELHITSQYGPDEKIESPNLGIQRGRIIKQMLVQTGIPSERIVIKPHITQLAFAEDDSFYHSFSFTFKPLNPNRIEALKKQIPEPRVVYPTFSSQGIMVNEELNIFKGEVSEIIKENPNLHLEVIGHTDNVGNAIDNYRKGLEYARQLRWYLVTKAGIDRNKITAVSKGESEAIASNSNDSGRDLNRRIEVKFYLANDE